MTTPNFETSEEVVSEDEPLTKEALELKKLQLEIKDLERPFWKRPAYVLAALPTLLAVITLSVGFINGYFSAQLTKLENQRHDVEVQIKDFEAKRDVLSKQYEAVKIEAEKARQDLENVQIEGRNLRSFADYQAYRTRLCEEELWKYKK
ncbi:MAG TPA: hypothetical protein VF543_07635 [Pyrinomonadaceae bacterium]|jgi:outer membrane murein-binding lipoprotein Lpp